MLSEYLINSKYRVVAKTVYLLIPDASSITTLFDNGRLFKSINGLVYKLNCASVSDNQ